MSSSYVARRTLLLTVGLTTFMAFVFTPTFGIATAARVYPRSFRVNRLYWQLSRFRRPSSLRMMAGTTADKDPKQITEPEWRQLLSPEEYHVIRQKGTERPGTGEYDGFYPKEGYFACRACGNPLYSAESKFRSGCGWPAFDKCYENAVKTKTDISFGMRRIEIMCNRCDGHLGHVFEGERMTPTNERHCVNSVSCLSMSASLSLHNSTSSP